jgi:hypothetical protein
VADSIPALVAGGLMIVVGLGIAWFQWRHRQPDASEDELTQLHAARQLRRRLQVSGLMVLVGILIPLGDLLPTFRRSPVAFALFWAAILLVLFWIMLLAAADFVSARSYHNLANLRMRQQRRELERELDRLRISGNGHKRDEH